MSLIIIADDEDSINNSLFNKLFFTVKRQTQKKREITGNLSMLTILFNHDNFKQE